MGIWSTIDCEEVHTSDSENYSIEGGFQASVTLKVSAANKDALIDDLLGNQREWPRSTFPTKPRAFSASVSGFYSESPVIGQTYVYDEYLATIQYSTDPNKTIVSETIEPDAEFIRLDHRNFRWSSDGAPLTEGEAPGFLQTSMKLIRKYFNQIEVPTLLLTPGVVHNAAYVSSLGLTFPAETLLLTPQPISRTVTTAGSEGFNFSVGFSYKPNGWNKYWRPDTQTWDRIILANGTAYNSYPLVDLTGVLS